MWPEPLTPTSTDESPYRYTVTVHAGDGTPVAAAPCVVNRDAGTGLYGEMQILDPNGGPRQRLRALVLLTREALRHGEEIGVTDVHTDAPLRLQAFAARLTGMPGEPRGAGFRFRGQLHQVRTVTLDESQADGALIRGDLDAGS